MTSQVINTPVGIPAELNWALPSSMVPSRKFELRVSPFGQSTFTQSGQSIKITLPQMQRTLYNFQTGYLMATISFTAGAGAGTDVNYLLGSWYSLFNRQVVRATSGYVLETIENPGLLVNAITSMTMGASEKVGLNNSFGFSNLSGYNNLGVKINTVTTASDIGGTTGSERNFSFALPLIGILNNSKLFPAFVGDLEIELTLADINRFLLPIAGNVMTGFTISNVEYVVECLELSPESYNMIMAQNPERVVIKSQTYSYGASALPGGTVGTVDIPFQIKLNSLKQLIWYSQPTDAAEKQFAGVNPNLENYAMIINGISWPQRPVQAKYPSEAFMQNQKAFGSVYSSSHSGCGTRTEFNTASTVTYSPYHRPYNTSTISGVLEGGRANKWYQCIDFETINSNKESLYNGVSTNGTTCTLRLNVGSPLANVTHNIHYFSCQDAMITIDLATNIINVII